MNSTKQQHSNSHTHTTYTSCSSNNNIAKDSYDPKEKPAAHTTQDHSSSSSSSERAPLLRYNNGSESSAYQTIDQTQTTRRRNTSKSPDTFIKQQQHKGDSKKMRQGTNRVYSPQQDHAASLRVARTMTFDDQSMVYHDDDQSLEYRGSRSIVSEIPRSTRQVSSNRGQASVPHQPVSYQEHIPTTAPGRLRLFGEADLPHEIYNVRKSALTVMEPLANTWLIISVGLSISVGLASARFLHLLPTLPFWIIFMPSLLSHLGVLLTHIRSAKNLSHFISSTNEGRQRPDSRDQLDRTEYLPLLQRSLKFGLKTGTLCFLLFVFQLLLYLHFSAEETFFGSNDRKTVSLNTCLIPVWILVIGGLCDGIVCKTQSLLRIICWTMAFASMLMLVLKLDYGFDEYTWTTILFPMAIILLITGGSLIYVLYGHQLGYFQLTELQYMAGIMYCIAIFMMFCLCIVLSEVIPGMVPDMQTRLVVVVLAPLVVGLIGSGAWGVSKDEYKRMLLLGGQQSVHPMRLRLEPAGWTCVESQGVALFPMFGEVNYEPLDTDKTDSIIMCICFSMCQCYPFEEKCKDEEEHRYQNPRLLGPVNSTGSAATARSSHTYMTSNTSRNDQREGIPTVNSDGLSVMQGEVL